MAQITIKGYKVLFDECDRELIESRTWGIRFGWNETPYLASSIGIFHRIVTNAPKGKLVDHKNHNTLDNRRKNLRVCTRSQNMWNRKKTCGSSKYKGVYWHKQSKSWCVEVYVNDKRVMSKSFKNEDDAARFYNENAKELFGEFACLNKIKRKK